MAEHQRSARRWFTAFTMAASLLLSSNGLVLAGPGDVNSINDGPRMNPGEYYNTPGGVTKFINSNKNGIHLHEGDIVTGREVNGAGALTGNGGNIHIDAPGQVVRLDGGINVNAGSNGSMFLGNGGNVKIDAGFLYQNGQIFANGVSGGNINANVGAMTMGKDGRIEATGQGGNGGVVNINSPGSVDIRKGAVIDTSGKVIGNYDTNVINIKGGLVNMEGILTANGIKSSDPIPNTGTKANDGGFINIQATGSTKALDKTALNNSGTMFTAGEKTDLVNRDTALRKGNTDPNQSTYVGERLDGSIRVASTGVISANGAHGNDAVPPTNPTPGSCGSGSCAGAIQPGAGGNGGKIVLDACEKIIQDGTIQANGGNAGKFVAANDATNPLYPKNPNQDIYGQNGLNGGKGGTITFNYRTAMIPGVGSKIEAKGGNASNGQDAIPKPGYVGYGGKGGDGGDGGVVTFNGPQITPENGNLPDLDATVNVDGGAAGKGGNLGVCNACRPEGPPGAPGNPGEIVKGPAPPDCPTCQPPPENPPPPSNPPSNPPDRSLYPKEYPRLGEALPGTVGPLVNYNRSVYMARSPLPIVKKRTPVLFPARSVPPPQLRKAVPPQRKAPVRGYW